MTSQLIMQKCRLEKIVDYPFQLSKQQNYMTLNYICFVDPINAAQLQIVGHGFRYLTGGQAKKLIMIIIDSSLKNNREQIVVFAPYTVIRWFNHFSSLQIQRQSIGLYTPQLPKLQKASQINIYFNVSFKVDQALIKFISNCDFVCQTGEYFIDIQWMKPIVNTFKSMRQKLRWQLLIKQCDNQHKNYLRIFIQTIEGKQARLFKKGQTKLTIKQQQLHSYNIFKTIQLGPLQQFIYELSYYTQAMSSIRQEGIKNEIVWLQTQKDIGVERFLQAFSQDINISFKSINCQHISSSKEFWNQFQSITSLQDSIILIRNIEYIYEVYQSQQILNFQLKHIINNISKTYQQFFNKPLKRYCIIIESYSQISIQDTLTNSRTISIKIDKKGKEIIFQRIFGEFDPFYSFKDEVIQQFSEKFGWQILRNYFLSSWKDTRELPKAEAFKKLRELVKQQQVENLIEVSWDDVGGLQTAKQEIIQTVLLPIRHPQIFDEWIKPRTGLLFYGPPGTGKTLLGKCVAKQCKMSFISVKGPQLLNMYVGESEKNVRSVFERAKACSPCIVFMDELDALVPKRGNNGDSNQVMDRIVAELLQQMDSASANQVFIIGATNRPDLLDPSIMRPGRFDKQIYLGITQARQDRIKIIKAQTRHLALEQNLNWDRIVQRVPKNFTGADFYGLTSKAVMAAAERTIQQYEGGVLRQKITLTEQDFLTAIEGIKPSVTEADLAKYETLKKIYS